MYHIMLFYFFFNDTATTEIYTLSLHDALPIYRRRQLQVRRRHDRLGQSLGWRVCDQQLRRLQEGHRRGRSEEHTSELQSQFHLVCRLLLEKKKIRPSPPACDCKLYNSDEITPR